VEKAVLPRGAIGEWMPSTLLDPLRIGSVTAKNRFYRAPVLEVAPQNEGAARILRRELEPSAAAGCGLVFQGASLVTPTGGRTAPGLLRIHDRDFVLSLKPAVDAVHEHGALIFCQMGHGALQTMETWHKEYRDTHPDVETLAVSKPPWWFRLLTRTPVLKIPRLRVFTTEELHGLAKAFGRSAGYLMEAGYDGVHLAGANASIFQQLWSPVFNRRTDEFGGRTLQERGEFLRVVVREIRRHTRPDFPIVAKVPAETHAPFFVRKALTIRDGVEIARICEEAGLDAVVPVTVGVTRDQSVARGNFPEIAWTDPRWQQGYERVLGSRRRVRLIRTANRAAARLLPFEPVWNEGFFSEVKKAVSIPVLAEGGIRTRAEIDRLLREGKCDMVGMARPFYAEPHLAARILHDAKAEALCANCNNCTIPQITGATGVCRTPAILQKRGELQRAGAYDLTASGSGSRE